MLVSGRVTTCKLQACMTQQKIIFQKTWSFCLEMLLLEKILHLGWYLENQVGFLHHLLWWVFVWAFKRWRKVRPSKGPKRNTQKTRELKWTSLISDLGNRTCVRIPFAHPDRGALLKAPRERPQEHRHLLPLYHATVGLKAPNGEGVVPQQRHSFSWKMMSKKTGD